MEPVPPKRRARPTGAAPHTSANTSPTHLVPYAGQSACAGSLAVGVGEFTQLALWMAASLAGLVTAVLLSRGPFFEALARRVGWLPRGGRQNVRRRKPTAGQSLRMLADAVVGNSKAAVASVFGPPRTAVVYNATTTTPSFWEADTWYYPLPRGGKFAIAIQFDDDFASGVQFLQAPRS